MIKRSARVLGKDSVEKFMEKNVHLFLGLVLISLGFFILLQGLISIIPHELPETSLVNSVYGDKDGVEETKKLYMYEHEKVGDTTVRNIIGYTKITTGVLLMILGNISIFGVNFNMIDQLVGSTNTESPTGKYQKVKLSITNYLNNLTGIFKHKFIAWFAYILLVLIFIGLILIILYHTGSLNSSSKYYTLKYETERKNKICSMRGKEIIFNDCAGDRINELYDTCIDDSNIMQKLQKKCESQMNEYAKVNENEINPTILSAEDKEFYKNIERNINNRNKEFESKKGGYIKGYTKINFNCNYIVPILLENDETKGECQKKAQLDYKEKYSTEYNNCKTKSENNAKFNKDNLYSKKNPDGFTWSTCDEEKEFKRIKAAGVIPAANQAILDNGIKCNPTKNTNTNDGEEFYNCG